MLDVNQLRVIDAVARLGSVTAAAKELHYSQPSVTHHLTRLEAETGAQLLQRVGRGIRLTPAGQLLADRAAEIIGRLDAASAELSAHVGLTAGRVRLAAFASAIASLVPAAVATLAEQLATSAPPVVLDVRTPREWQSKHITGSLNVPLNQLPGRLQEVPRQGPLVLHCQSGYRSAIAAIRRP